MALPLFCGTVPYECDSTICFLLLAFTSSKVKDQSSPATHVWGRKGGEDV
jgi:hypothetical protein